LDNTGKGLWAETAEVFHRNLKPCLAYVFAVLAIAFAAEFVKSNSSFTVAQSFAAALLAIPAHLTVLKNQAGFAALNVPANGKLTMPFVFRGLGLGFLALIPFLAALIALIAAGMPEWTALLASVAVLLVFAALVFAKWGTMLPAVLAQDDKTLSRAGQRGSLVMGYALPRLLLCFGFLSAVQIGLVFGFTSVGEGDGNFFPVIGGFDVLLFAATLIGSIIGAFQIVMTAVILSRSYLRAEGKTAVA
jgi:hypothetical protein